ncbi:hypothetical protein VMCG_06650 [Cytospora schulzeri]|uniref:Uncharacterized protein n=1 Tax=Cytospora schulzeri TaxID=448051 RepID=A0A423W736_9PEZI|nr:hypothetical protein VMCG_06650 [Valsa malicola]
MFARKFYLEQLDTDWKGTSHVVANIQSHGLTSYDRRVHAVGMAWIPSQPAEYGISSSPSFPKSPPGRLNIYDMSSTDLANHFIEIIHRTRGKSLIKQDLKRVPMDVGLISNSDQLVIYNTQQNCLYKYRMDEVPKDITHKLESLARAQDFGVGCFNQLYEMLKKAIEEYSISRHPEEDFGKGVEGAVAMLAELSSIQIRSCVRPNYTMPSDANKVNVHVVLVDNLGESHKYSHNLRPDADFQSFLEEMNQKFPKYCHPYSHMAYNDWDTRVQDLKKTGLDGYPVIDRIEGLITLHRATEDKDLPQWMYYTILEGRDGEELHIKDEASFKAMMQKAAKKESPACLMRISEAKFRNIFVELRFLEEQKLASARSRERTRTEDKDDDEEYTSENDNDGHDDPFFDPEPFGDYQRLTYFYNLDHHNPKCFEGQQHDA